QEWYQLPEHTVFDPEVIGSFIFQAPLILPADSSNWFSNTNQLAAPIRLEIDKLHPQILVRWNGNPIDSIQGIRLSYGEMGAFELEIVNSEEPDYEIQNG